MEVAVALLSRLFAGWLQPAGNATLQANCLALKTNFTFENTAILGVSYLPGPSKLAPLGICETGKVRHSAPMCRVQFHTNTSAESGIDAEMWLPDEWNGRFMGLGNRGLTGCIRYDQLEYSSSMLHFATVSTNGGHDGDTAQPLLKNPDSLLDYASRAVHTEAVIGKQLLEAYYGGAANHSYYMGCSQGGRQGVQSALQHPDDFDGILVGAPTVDFSNLMHWTAMQHAHVAGNSSISPAAWKKISKEVLRQCDALDGVADGIITEPDSCDFRPESLLCYEGQPKGAFCLTVAQVDALRNIYAPMYGAGGKLISARFDPGAESSPLLGRLYGEAMLSHPASWLKYVVLNGSEVQGKDYGITKNKAIRAATGEEMDTSSGDFSAFRERGGKLITYHGRADGILPSGRSKQYYDHVSRTNSLPTLDDFYRLFLIPGMDHCENGPGAFKFGQSATAAAPTTNSTHDIISALVDWVENGVAPESIVGADVKGKEREHCRYPMKSVWNVEAGRSFSDRQPSLPFAVMHDDATPSPALRVPPEILGEIFLQFTVNPLFARPPVYGRWSPLVLSLVCSYWRSAALSTPRLWSSFYISSANGAPHDIEPLLALWLERSAEAPLVFEFQFDKQNAPEDVESEPSRKLFDLLLAHRWRWQRAIICAPLVEYLAHLGVGEGSLPLLKTLELDHPFNLGPFHGYGTQIVDATAAPQLTCLVLGILVHVRSITTGLPWMQLTRFRGECLYAYEVLLVIQLAQNLLFCNVDVVDNPENNEHELETVRLRSPLAMLSLRTLVLRSHPNADTGWLEMMLDPDLTLPALEVLRIVYRPFQIGVNELDCLETVLKGSRSSLKELYLPDTKYLRVEAKRLLPSFADVIILEDEENSG
uniref:Carboxylic ester hydrolase n=1 Tax=Mycena chlorophos TaxID=658473 RepID=A0ABQ0L881_MYCCL|nr:predicted protein [Mycena chlorophos]